MINRIEEKKAEIEHYKGVLERYGSGRWYDQGRRHLEELERELDDLIKQENLGPRCCWGHASFASLKEGFDPLRLHQNEENSL